MNVCPLGRFRSGSSFVRVRTWTASSGVKGRFSPGRIVGSSGIATVEWCTLAGSRVLGTLPGKFSELGLAEAGGVVAASVEDASGFEARGPVGAGETPLLLCPGQLAAMLSRPGLTDFAVADCGGATGLS
jgi:hypothetical protein